MEVCEYNPLVAACLLIDEKRIELMREGRRISSPEVRKLARVYDYIEAVMDVEAMEWPDTLE